jgi:hypothetical protein
VFCFSLASTAALGQGLSAGRIVGNIDGIAVDAGGRPARLIVKGVEANVLIGVSFPG